MEQCVFLIPEDACLAIIWLEEMRIRGHAHIRVVGNILLWKKKRPGEYMPVFENERGTFIFNSKDLCMVEHMDDILNSGIDSLKIEGRMKTALYVATVARTYRKAIDDYMEAPEKYKANMSWYQEQISNCTYRQFTTGFFYGKPDEHTQIYDNNTYVKEYTYLGYAEEVDENGFAHITQEK